MPKDHRNEDEIAIYACELLQEFFAPANDFHDATDFLSTGDALGLVKDLHPTMEVDPDLLFDALRDAGFKYKHISKGTGVRWLFRKKTNA